MHENSSPRVATLPDPQTMATQPQPDFLRIGRSAQELADQLLLLPNIPALDYGAELVLELRAIRGRLDQIDETIRTGFDRLETKLNVR